MSLADYDQRSSEVDYSWVTTMRIYKLPDGTWCTTPSYMGRSVAEPCTGSKHQWETVGSPTPLPDDAGPEGVNVVSMQKCNKCGYQRMLLHEE